jgi:hypothetical protein
MRAGSLQVALPELATAERVRRQLPSRTRAGGLAPRSTAEWSLGARRRRAAARPVHRRASACWPEARGQTACPGRASRRLSKPAIASMGRPPMSTQARPAFECPRRCCQTMACARKRQLGRGVNHAAAVAQTRGHAREGALRVGQGPDDVHAGDAVEAALVAGQHVIDVALDEGERRWPSPPRARPLEHGRCDRSAATSSMSGCPAARRSASAPVPQPASSTRMPGRRSSAAHDLVQHLLIGQKPGDPVVATGVQIPQQPEASRLSFSSHPSIAARTIGAALVAAQTRFLAKLASSCYPT